MPGALPPALINNKYSYYRSLILIHKSVNVHNFKLLFQKFTFLIRFVLCIPIVFGYVLSTKRTNINNFLIWFQESIRLDSRSQIQRRMCKSDRILERWRQDMQRCWNNDLQCGGWEVELVVTAKIIGHHLQ